MKGKEIKWSFVILPEKVLLIFQGCWIVVNLCKDFENENFIFSTLGATALHSRKAKATCWCFPQSFPLSVLISRYKLQTIYIAEPEVHFPRFLGDLSKSLASSLYYSNSYCFLDSLFISLLSLLRKKQIQIDLEK